MSDRAHSALLSVFILLLALVVAWGVISVSSAEPGAVRNFSSTPTDLDPASPTDLDPASPTDLDPASPTDLDPATPTDLYSRIDCEFWLPDELPQIGLPYEIIYNLYDGSGRYENVTLDCAFYTEARGRYIFLDSQTIMMRDAPSDSTTIIPVRGSLLKLHIYGQDAVTGQMFDHYMNEYIPVAASMDIDVYTYTTVEQTTDGDVLRLQYDIQGASSIHDASIWWYTATDTTERYPLDKQDITALTDEVTFTPMTGRTAFAVIEGYDQDDRPFYAETGRFDITSRYPINLACAFTFPDETAQIGRPYTFSYELSGGSGSYTSLQMGIMIDTFIDHTFYHHLDTEWIDVGQASGTVTFTPAKGTLFGCFLQGTDAITGEEFSLFEYGGHEIAPNPDYSVSFRFQQSGHYVGGQINAAYSIDGLDDPVTDGTISWYIRDPYGYSWMVDQTEVVSGTGFSSVTPDSYGYYYAIFEGKDQDGHPIYGESEGISVTARAEEYQRVTCDFFYPGENPRIGAPWTVSYVLSGGSGQYEDVVVDYSFYNQGRTWYSYLDRQRAEMDGSWYNTSSVIPVRGSWLTLSIFGRDAVTGQAFEYYTNEYIPVGPAVDIDISLQPTVEHAADGDVIRLQYGIQGVSSIHDASIWWYTATDSGEQYPLNTQEITALTGEITFTPLSGKTAFAVIEGFDQDDRPFYAATDMLEIVSRYPDEIACAFTFPDDPPQIGHPYTFSYEVSGGSGSFQSLRVGIRYQTIIDGYIYSVIGGEWFDIGDAASGTVTFTPSKGVVFGCMLRGTDAVTGEEIRFDSYEDQRIAPNPDYPVEMTLSGNGYYYVDDRLWLYYQIDGLDGPLTDCTISWFRHEQNGHTERTDYSDVNSDGAGISAIVPEYSGTYYAIIEGKDQYGNPIYAESEQISVGMRLYGRIKCDFTYPDENPKIGAPYPISYSLSGGSGLYTDVRLVANYYTSVGSTGWHLGTSEAYFGSDDSGSWTFIPEKGNVTHIALQATDAATGEHFVFECGDDPIWTHIDPNPDFPVTFTFDRDSYAPGDAIRVSYQIGGLDGDCDLQLWWAVLDGTDYDIRLQPAWFDQSTGTATFDPAYRQTVYAVIEGCDESGNPIYAESRRIQLLPLEGEGTFMLPESLQTIEEEAFAGTAVRRLYIPAGLTDIAYDAFTGTPLKIIAGTTYYAEDYANDHMIVYQHLENE